MIEILEWDSNFFGIKVGSFNLTSEFSDYSSLENQIKKSNLKLIYLFDQEKILESKPEISLILKDAKLIDQKVTYKKTVNIIEPNVNNEIFENDGELSVELLELAYSAGQYSRFYIDPKMPEGKGKALYKLWIEGSVQGRIADKVYVYKENNIVRGFVTLKNKKDSLSIGLIAVSENSRGNGIGKKLMHAVDNFAVENNLSVITVVTQLENKIACSFYESHGYEVDKIENIYHCWL